jgi:hypothetical protein
MLRAYYYNSNFKKPAAISLAFNHRRYRELTMMRRPDRFSCSAG